MLNFADVTSIQIPEGKARSISVNGTDLWGVSVPKVKFNYVSLGDSIAAGHTIDENWEKDYGWNSQYTRTDDKTGKVHENTVIVPNCYTDLIRRYLYGIYGEANVDAKSFAVSGSVVKFNKDSYDPRSLYEILDDEPVKNALKYADLVTICIGANDVLGPAGDFIGEYINTGDLTEFGNAVENNIKILKGEKEGISYTDLFDKLNNINPNAKYVFTTIYNPYKYLWASKGTWDNEYKDSFFHPILRFIPEVTTVGIEWDRELKKLILTSDTMTLFFNRMNNLGYWSEKYVNLLNEAIKDTISAYKNPNFIIADTKALFDSIPDRDIPHSDNLHYNDLVSVEFTRNFDISEMDWGQLYSENIIKDKDGNPVSNTVCNDAATFWDVLLGAYGFTAENLLNGDTEGLASTLIMEVLEEVIAVDADPHPETHGQYLMYRSFADALGWQSLKTITYVPNGGTGSMRQQKVLDKSIVNNVTKGVCSITLPNDFSHPTEGYYFSKWNKAADGSKVDYSNGESIYVTSDITLYAQWSNMYILSVDSVPNSKSVTQRPDDTGIQDGYYQLWIAGSRQPDFGYFSNPPRVVMYPYGTPVGVIVKTVCGSKDLPSIRVNGATIQNTWDEYNKGHAYQFDLKKHTHIEFEWCDWGCVPNPLYPVGDKYIGADAYWDCYITTY